MCRPYESCYAGGVAAAQGLRRLAYPAAAESRRGNRRHPIRTPPEETARVLHDGGRPATLPDSRRRAGVRPADCPDKWPLFGLGDEDPQRDIDQLADAEKAEEYEAEADQRHGDAEALSHSCADSREDLAVPWPHQRSFHPAKVAVWPRQRNSPARRAAQRKRALPQRHKAVQGRARLGANGAGAVTAELSYGVGMPPLTLRVSPLTRWLTRWPRKLDMSPQRDRKPEPQPQTSPHRPPRNPAPATCFIAHSNNQLHQSPEVLSQWNLPPSCS